MYSTVDNKHYLGDFEIDSSVAKVVVMMTKQEREYVLKELVKYSRFTASLLEHLATAGDCTVRAKLKWSHITCFIKKDKPAFYAGPKRVSKEKADERLSVTLPLNVKKEYLLDSLEIIEEYTVSLHSVDVLLKMSNKQRTPRILVPTVADAVRIVQRLTHSL